MARADFFPILIGLLGAGAFIIGIFFRGLDQPLFTPALLCVLLMAGLMLSGGVRRGWSFPASAVMGFLALFWLWMVWALSWSSVPQVSGIFTLLIGAMPLLVFTTLQHPRATELVRAQMVAVAGVMVAVALWALVQFFFLHDLAGSRIHHPMLNTNNLAVLLVMPMFPMLMWFHQAKGWKSALLPGACLVLLLMAIMTTQSRGGVLGLICGTAVLSVFCFPLLRQQAKRFIWLLAGMICGLIIIFSVVDMREEAIRLIGGGNSMASVNERFLLLGSGLRMMMDHPFPGIGLGVFYLAFPPYRHPEDISDGYFLHVDPIQFGIEMSPVASVLFYSFCIAVLVRTVLAVRAAPNTQARASVLLPFSALVSLLVNAHVNFDLYMLPALMAAAVMLGAWFLGTENILGPARLHLALNRPAYAVFLIPAFVLLFILSPAWLVRAGIGVRESNLASAALSRNDIPTAQTHIDTAMKYGAPSYYRTYHIQSLLYVRQFRTQFFSMTANQRDTMFQEALLSADMALRYNPYYVPVINQKAILYVLAFPRLDLDGREKAESLLQQALLLDPLSFDTRLGLAKVLVMNNRKDQAINVLEDGFYWKGVRRYAPLSYRQLLIQLKKETGQYQDVTNLTREMAQYTAMIQAKEKTRIGMDRWVDMKLKALLQ